ncbi:hypothetical protein ZHAS_00019265 [Anopheles sinensis]|uniref:Uncharacterized protein n=1 Tax=Anopheles sinensis TaxID=74873 RepID=A0A084WL22_ANOSI|nr:hypothetical protein ZHAS_00019265 [Anopheles sinensis]
MQSGGSAEGAQQTSHHYSDQNASVTKAQGSVEFPRARSALVQRHKAKVLTEPFPPNGSNKEHSQQLGQGSRGMNGGLFGTYRRVSCMTFGIVTVNLRAPERQGRTTSSSRNGA